MWGKKNKKEDKESKVSMSYVFKTIIWPRKAYILVGFGLIIISRLSGLVLPGASKYLIDDVIAEKDTDMLKFLLIVVFIAILIQSVTSFLLTRILSVEAHSLIAKLRAKVQKKILLLPVRYFDNNKTGELVARIMTDVEGVRNLVGTGFVRLIGGFVSSIISLILLINISHILTAYILIPIGIFGIVSLKAFSYIRPIFRERRKIYADITGRLTETLNGVRVIKGFNAEQQEVNIFVSGVNKLFRNIKKSLTATAIITSSSQFLLGLTSTGIMGIGGYMIMKGDITIGEFISFTLYLGFMIAPIVQMGNVGSQITEALAGLDRTKEIMNMKTEYDNSQRYIKLKDIKGDIEFKNVSFAYEKGKNVISNISFKSQAGSVTALVGSSGSGKSTIAGLVASFISPGSGKITLDGKDTSLITHKTYRSKLGVVLQDDFLFGGTIKENILFARPKSNGKELQNAVNAAYVDEFTDKFDNGLDTIIGERGVKLSGGQRQRIAIARAILANPEILILDEATSNLDTESEHLIQKSLSNLMKGRTTLVIAHRLSTIRSADQILIVEDGKIAERGNHTDLINKKGRYYELYTYQSRI